VNGIPPLTILRVSQDDYTPRPLNARCGCVEVMLLATLPFTLQ